MAEVEDYDFSVGDAGASHTYPLEAGQIRVGGCMCIKERPAKVINWLESTISFLFRIQIVYFVYT